MKELCLKAGIEDKVYGSVLLVGSEEKLKEVRQFLIDLYSNEYREYKKIYKEMPPEAWANYEMIYESDEYPLEYKHLNKCAHILKVKWSKRPKKGKHKSNLDNIDIKEQK